MRRGARAPVPQFITALTMAADPAPTRWQCRRALRHEQGAVRLPDSVVLLTAPKPPPSPVALRVAPPGPSERLPKLRSTGPSGPQCPAPLTRTRLQPNPYFDPDP